MSDPYREKGYDNRSHYLLLLAQSMGIKYEIVLEVAYLLGEEEDFDGLVTELRDMQVRGFLD